MVYWEQFETIENTVPDALKKKIKNPCQLSGEARSWAETVVHLSTNRLSYQFSRKGVFLEVITPLRKSVNLFLICSITHN